MSKLNLSLFLNAFNGLNSNNNPPQNYFRWEYKFQSLGVVDPSSVSLFLAPGESKTLFTGALPISSDNTTTYNFTLDASSTYTYRIQYNSGTLPSFRTLRNTGEDATTQVTVTQNGTALTFTSTGGTPFNLISGGVIVGDEVRIGTGFNIANQGIFDIIAATATSFSVNNILGVPEGPLTLGSGFADVLRIYSSNGIQIGDTVDLSTGFSLVNQGFYTITDVRDDYIEIYSPVLLTNQTAISGSLTIFKYFKSLVYIESDQKISVTLNGSSTTSVNPVVSNPNANNMNCGGGTSVFSNSSVQLPPVPNNGIFLVSGSFYSINITNISNINANIYTATVS